MAKVFSYFNLIMFVIMFFCAVIVFNLPNNAISMASNEKNNFEKITVVLDAGHGGQDGGAVGVKTGVKESDLNLEYSLCLQTYLESAGFKVVQTRITKQSLAPSNALGFKKQDMLERKKIIENAKPDIVISIHMNKFSMQSVRGAQTFFQKGSSKSEMLAKNIQSLFVNKLNSPKTLHIAGDYFICKCFECPSVIVECGFLSNMEDEQLLITEEYKNKVCYAIFGGIIKFLCN